jgi:hypothetical protein
MSTRVRVAGFLAIVLAMFGLAFGLGKLADVDDPAPAHGHGTSSPAASDEFTLAVRGDASAPAGHRMLRFEVLDADGMPVTAYDERHERDLHLILVDKQDPRIYQHVHPKLGDDGVWSVPIDLGPGSYRIYADTQPTGAEPQVLTADLTVPGSRPGYDPLPSPNRTATVDGFTVGLAEAGDMLSFEVERGGRPVELEPYLGAGGHLVAIRADNLDYLHAHPMEGTDQPIGFHVEFDEPGRFVLHFDFQVAGVVHSATFVYDKYAEASRVPTASSHPTVMPLDGTDHGMAHGMGDTGEMSGHDH